VKLGSVAAALAGLMVLGAHGPSALGAQTISGQLLEAGTDRAIPFAEVDAMDEDGDVVASALSDGTGHFSVKLKKAGAYTLYASRLGYYAAVSTSIDVEERQDVAVAIRLSPAPVEVDSLTVGVEPRVTSLDQVGFYGRKAAGVGHFITRLDIEKMIGIHTLADVVREVPGVQLARNQFGQESVLLRDAMGLPCSPVLLLDGMAINPPWEKILDPHEVDGVEVYSRPTQIPLRFASLIPPPTRGGAESRCGVVVAWSRSGNRRH
jgi:hypothetical protein